MPKAARKNIAAPTRTCEKCFSADDLPTGLKRYAPAQTDPQTTSAMFSESVGGFRFGMAQHLVWPVRIKL